MRKLLLISIGSIGLLQCSTKTAQLESHSPNGPMHIRVLGEKANFLDPYKVNVAVVYETGKEEIGTEIFVTHLDSSNVRFHWTEPATCKIVFLQQDDTERILLTKVVEGRIGIKDISPTP